MSDFAFETGDPSDQVERQGRFKLLASLFEFYRERDYEHRLGVYLLETDEIPLDKLQLAVRAVLRTHKYPGLPSIADLWRLARAAAGMDREQYRAGRYLPPPREWPPPGKRYGVTAGSVEALPAPEALPALGPGATGARQRDR